MGGVPQPGLDGGGVPWAGLDDGGYPQPGLDGGGGVLWQGLDDEGTQGTPPWLGLDGGVGGTQGGTPYPEMGYPPPSRPGWGTPWDGAPPPLDRAA